MQSLRWAGRAQVFPEDRAEKVEGATRPFQGGLHSCSPKSCPSPVVGPAPPRLCDLEQVTFPLCLSVLICRMGMITGSNS